MFLKLGKMKINRNCEKQIEVSKKRKVNETTMP